MSSRVEEKQKRKQEREAREAEAAKASSSRRRLGLLGGAAFIAVAVVLALVLISGGGNDDGDAPAVGDLFQGIPQQGTVLGNPEAPVTLVEYVDLQCPFCRDYSVNVLPGIVKRYVRDGRVKLDLRVLTFLGPDSQRAGLIAGAAAQQDKAWNFTESFFRQQGEENSGYATDEFLRGIAQDAGLDVDDAFAQRESQASIKLLTDAQSDAEDAEVSSTPSFQIIREGEEPEPLEVSSLELESFTGPLDQALRAGGG